MTSSIEARLNEKVVQKGLALHISTLGWKLTEDDELLNRPFENVFINEDLITSVIKLNPEIAEDNKKSEEVISKLRAVLLSVRNDGLVASNEEFVAWLCGRRTIKYIGTDQIIYLE
jgi:type I restriction enzyme R subunit